MAEKAPPRAEEALAEAYQRHVGTIYGLCFLYLRNAADAEDAVQSVFLKLLRAQKSFCDCGHERAWLIVTAKNHCRNILKHWWRSRRADLRELPEAADREAGAPISDIRHLTSGRHKSQAPGTSALASLLALPEKYKTVLYLHYFAGYTTKELARILKRNESTIRTQLARGRERLKIDLEEYTHE